MASIEKRIESWRNTKQEITCEKVEPVIRKYFPNYNLNTKGTSHKYMMSHPTLRGVQGYGEIGGLTIPITKGQKIKPIYIKKLIAAIDIIKENEKNE